MSGSQIEIEAAQVTAPLQNNSGMKCIAVIAVGTASGVTDLATLFGSLGNGHFFTLTADTPDTADSRIYVAFGTNSAGTISETATGNGPTVCWPIPDKSSLPVRLLSGNVRASGIATLSLFRFLYHKGLASGYLRVYRSSVGSSQGAEQFPPPT